MVGPYVFAGEAAGEETVLDLGGNIELFGGVAAFATGGSFLFQSGYGASSSSGFVALVTANAGELGVSGSIALSTGTTSLGNSGYVFIGTGTATSGTGGDIDVIVGSGTCGSGGNIFVSAGETTNELAVGGAVQITGGHGSFTGRTAATVATSL